MTREEILAKIDEKYENLGENPDTYLKGLLQAKPINYWDYIQVDTLLSLQKPRTDFEDEEIFIMYHQVTELVLKLMIHELKQITSKDLAEEILADKVNRLNRYTEMLMTSFDVMRYGMDYDDYNTFRSTLAPASGFQSAQFRFLEIYCTPVENLINSKGKERLPEIPTVEDLFDQVYWKDAGHNRKTGKKSLTLRAFEDKYLNDFIELAEAMKGNTLAEKFLKINNPSDALKNGLRDMDYLFNVKWPMIHLNTAQHYLNKKGEEKAATGGSNWQKYLHPKYQQRKFFPFLWTEKEILNWAENE
ncbi:tryptophan 2,3-dioxygenase family protein [Mesonia sp. K4-1]|jgi:tryptophan 2,3-dioxygenase|uniref:tryptophan 2,3-dioxygenase family protein n=1 Tax=Mesonia sp. K4-1 TaxID=2602760 RepID=UPI0011C96024|nr:tryptophan 2,3-dioxygenase family protein [Mesonia sp. K4-1]TXK79373.1 tryptophan 2,3-dioxygenase [Mesonia sp. K4-1]